MELLANVIDIFVSLDVHLASLVVEYGFLVYIILFATIFAETGLVVTPFLPGDSLLFVAGALSARALLSLPWLFALLFVAAIIGDAVNYWIGRIVGSKVFRYEEARFFKKEYLVSTHNFYEKYGAKTVLLARFIPILRTFVPFVAGVGHMSYNVFSFYNILGAFVWVLVFLGGGFLFGNIPFVADNFSIVILAIIVLSLLPGIFQYLLHLYRSPLGKKAKPTSETDPSDLDTSDELKAILPDLPDNEE